MVYTFGGTQYFIESLNLLLVLRGQYLSTNSVVVSKLGYERRYERDLFESGFQSTRYSRELADWRFVGDDLLGI